MAPGKHDGSLVACRENMDKQLFLLNSSLNNTILRTRDECVMVWELQLLGIEGGKVYSLQELQATYKAAAKVLDLPSTQQGCTCLKYRHCMLQGIAAFSSFYQCDSCTRCGSVTRCAGG